MSGNKLPIEVKRKGEMLLLPPYSYSLRRVAEELDVSSGIVHKWRTELIENKLMAPTGSSTSESFSAEQKFAHVIHCAQLSEIELSAYCREHGLFVEQVKTWVSKSLAAQDDKVPALNKTAKDNRADKKRIKQLERELARKDKALAETAALLVLREKFNALWEASEDD